MRQELVYRDHPVPPALAAQVQGLWEMEGACEHAAPHRILPDGCISIVLNFGDSMTQVGGRSDKHATAGHVVIAEMRRPITFQSQGRVQLLGVRFRPGAGQAFLGASLPELADDVAGDAGMALAMRQAAASAESAHPRDRVAVMASAMARLSEIPPRCSHLAAMAVQFLAHDRGLTGIDVLAAKVGVSRRHLERVFAREVGIAPKALADVLRFRRALETAERTAKPQWADVALNCGYFDQSHMIRHFRRFAGCSPTALQAERGSGDLI